MFADIASEMLYPVIPIYLRQVGFPVIWIGFLEGLAEFTVGLSKGYFGQLSDNSGRRLPLVRLGYFLSAASKPLMAVFAYPLWIFGARVTDRLGKGMRTAPRDALLAEQALPENRARVFTFHRAWDTVGAVVGPIAALYFLKAYPGKYTTLFYLAAIPGIISVLFLFLLKESRNKPATLRKGNFFSFFGYWKIAGKAYRQLVTALVIFAIANSSDVFLLLRAKEITGSDTITISAYIFYNLVYALSSYPMGILADRRGLKPVLILGILLFSVTYGGFIFAHSPAAVYTLFFVYGLYAAATEGIAKAWIANVALNNETATAMGLFSSLQSMTTFGASLLAGLLWSISGSIYVFIFSASLALFVAVYLATMSPARKA